MITDDSRFPDNDPRAMINKKIFPDGSAGMNINTGMGMGVFREDAWKQGHFQLQQLMRNPVKGNGEKTRISPDDLKFIFRGRVSFKDGGSVFIKPFVQQR